MAKLAKNKVAMRFYAHKIDATKLKIQLTKNKKEKVAYDKLVFGTSFTDHMLEIEWDKQVKQDIISISTWILLTYVCQNGWHDPTIVPFGDLAISPAAPALHYGIQVVIVENCFE